MTDAKQKLRTAEAVEKYAGQIILKSHLPDCPSKRLHNHKVVVEALEEAMQQARLEGLREGFDGAAAIAKPSCTECGGAGSIELEFGAFSCTCLDIEKAILARRDEVCGEGE